ncbi:MAG: hypothetical protein AAB289_15475, partial [Chloroflexota bacterium]
MERRRSGILALMALLFSGLITTTVTAEHQPVSGRVRRVAAMTAPVPFGPGNGVPLPSVGPVSFLWQLPAGATQYQLQVIPFNGDGPGVNVIRDAESNFVVPAPVLGQGPYVLLPGMSYTWRVRATDATVGVTESDPSWGPWTDLWVFTTPAPNAATIRLITPADGAAVATNTPALGWYDVHAALFYYEVQVSEDPGFNTDPATAISSVYWNLVHGGQSTPFNSWAVPPSAPLRSGVRHFWRVRPRVQGDGLQVAWSAPASFLAPDGPAPLPVAPAPAAPLAPVPTPTPGISGPAPDL